MLAGTAIIWHDPCLNISVVLAGPTVYSAGGSAQAIREAQECFISTKRGYTMPVFTFEKISPQDNRTPIPPVANKKQRGVVVKMIDRFVEARVKRSLKAEKGGNARNRQRPTE